jgi:hypothetical protein
VGGVCVLVRADTTCRLLWASPTLSPHVCVRRIGVPYPWQACPRVALLHFVHITRLNARHKLCAAAEDCCAAPFSFRRRALEHRVYTYVSCASCARNMSALPERVCGARACLGLPSMLHRQPHTHASPPPPPFPNQPTPKFIPTHTTRTQQRPRPPHRTHATCHPATHPPAHPPTHPHTPTLPSRPCPYPPRFAHHRTHVAISEDTRTLSRELRSPAALSHVLRWQHQVECIMGGRLYTEH